MKRIASLDGLRGVAILLVVAGHSWDAYGSRDGVMAWVAPIFANASLGVRLFFVLSGYLITTLLLEEREITGTISLPNFYARRALRIFPASYAFLGCILIFVIIGVMTISKPQLLAAATYTWNYFPLWHCASTAEGSWFLGHLWTLSLEEQFYLFWPATLLLLGNKKSLNLAVILVALMPIIRIGSYFLFPAQRGYLGMMLHTAIDTIMIGCVLALTLHNCSLRPLAVRVNLRVILPIALVFVFLVSPFLNLFFRGGYSITVGFTLDAIGAALLILHAGFLEPGALPAQMLSLPPLVFIGRLSYSWYLWQQLFLTRLNHTWTGSFPLSVLCSFGAALASYYLIERPFLRLKHKFSTWNIKNDLSVGTAATSNTF